MTTGRREYKDRLFIFIFGNPEHKDWTLSLYNAINGTSYDDQSALEFNTIEEVLYLSMHNDVSFLLAGEVNMYEQQSTYNPNMPLRMLQYAAGLYEKQIVPISKYSEQLLELPIPRLYVFYNGKHKADDETILRLSDSFPASTDADIEVRVHMINVNEGQQPQLMDACPPLREYAWMVGRIREKMESEVSTDLAVAISEVIGTMPSDFAIRPALMAHKAEVIDMLLTEYDEAREMELLRQAYKRQFMIEGREEGRKDGLKEGRKEGRKEGLKEGRAEGRKDQLLANLTNLMASLPCEADRAMDLLQVPIDQRDELMTELAASS